jgi:hypothetical protein
MCQILNANPHRWRSYSICDLCMNEYAAFVERYKKLKYSDKNPPECQSVHHTSHTDHPETEFGAL